MTTEKVNITCKGRLNHNGNVIQIIEREDSNVQYIHDERAVCISGILLALKDKQVEITIRELGSAYEENEKQNK